MNYYSLGICCVGNFDEEEMPKLMWQTLVHQLASYCVAWKLDPAAILGHKEVEDQNTACPGRFVDLTLLRASVMDVLQDGANT